MKAIRYLSTLLVMSLGLGGCGTESPEVQRANPASSNCVTKGGKHITESTPAGEMGICLFEDNRQCEEWALLRGHCPVGGIHVAGYASDEERHCAIRGGHMEHSECSLPAGGASP
jgi:putative hemolysin